MSPALDRNWLRARENLRGGLRCGGFAADESEIQSAAAELRHGNAAVEAVQADLSTIEGVNKLLATVGGRPVAALLGNAGRGLGRGFLDQDFSQIRHVVDTNVTGTLYLLHKVGSDMRSRGSGRILITGSIAGFMPGTFQAVYNGTKAFLVSFSFALRAELKNSGVTVTRLMPDATETGAVWMNKLRSAIANITPAGLLAEMHRNMAEPPTEKVSVEGVVKMFAPPRREPASQCRQIKAVQNALLRNSSFARHLHAPVH